MQILSTTFLFTIILVAREDSISENRHRALATLALKSAKKLFQKDNTLLVCDSVNTNHIYSAVPTEAVEGDKIVDQYGQPLYLLLEFSNAEFTLHDFQSHRITAVFTLHDYMG